MHTPQNIDMGVLDAALSALGRVSTIDQVEALPIATKPEERMLTIEQALRVISSFYVHLPMKRPRYAIDPVAALRLLQRELKNLTDLIFQHRLIGVLDTLRDVHLAYTPPAPYVSMVAFLPFLMERAGKSLHPKARFLVTRLLADFAHHTFRPGVEVISWDGTPIHRALALMAEIEGGNNCYSREALALQYMTVRWLGSARLPDARWVAVGYRGQDGEAYEIRLPWRVLHIEEDKGFMFGSQAVWMLEDAADKTGGPAGETGTPSTSKGLSLRSQVEARTRRRLFRTGAAKAEDEDRAKGDHERNADLRKMRSAVEGGSKGANLSAVVPKLSSKLPHHFEAEHIKADGRTYGYIRIRSFEYGDWLEFATEFRRLLALMPATGLALDVRSNPGGVIQCAEGILQFISPRRIRPLEFQYLGTEVAQLLTHRPGREGAGVVHEAGENEHSWARVVDVSLATGSTYSRGLPLSDPDEINVFGQEYYGPCAVIIDATSFSSAEMFAAGFQDHGIGPVIGVDPSTGGAGANCWTFDQLTRLGPKAEALLGIEPLPSGARIRFSARRCERIGPSAGVPLEELGVQADLIHNPTRRDIMKNNADLKDMVCAVLAGMKTSTLSVVTKAVGRGVELGISGTRIDRVDVILDRRTMTSLDYKDEPLSITLPLPVAAAASGAAVALRVEAYRGGKVVANDGRLLRG